MKKLNLLLSILLTLVLSFPMTALADDGMYSGDDTAGESVLAEDDFALISGGTFQMGSPAGEPERSSDETQHSVTVGDFYMAKTEVSQEDYQAVMGLNPSVTKGDNLPVTNITWYDAIQYCNRLSAAEGLTPCYRVSGTTVTWNKSANGYRLPTEAEWEYAARAATTTPFHFGDYVHNSDANCYNAYGYNNDASGNWVNGSDAYLRRTVAVDQYPANAYDLHNMHGNVAEWVWDWYGEYGSGAATNPSGPKSGNAKIVRGGGWNDHPKHIRSAYRGAHPAGVGLYSIGIRPVRNAGTAAGEIKSVYSAKAEQKTGKTLIVYFSQTGNTEGLANLIHEMSGADIFRLERKIPYSSSSNGPILYGEALDELRAEAVPELKAYPDIDQYDTILLGYCNWWSSIPASVRSFLLHDDFSGKTIVPFCSMGGGHFGQTISAIVKLAPNSVIKEGLEVTYSSYDRNEISAWLEKSLPAQSDPEPEPTPEPKGAHILVVYFSATNNTKGIASHIKTTLGDEADVYEIEAETPYTSADLNYNTDCRANREQNDPSARPAISGSVENMAQYDVVVLGYPIWWGQAPKIIYTFLESYDFSGKTILPFCTSASSPLGTSASNLHAVCPSSVKWLDGKRFSAGASKEEVEGWIIDSGIQIPEKEECSHSYERRVTVEATCTSAGEAAYTCIHCGESYTEIIPATGHKPVTDQAIPAGCETEGRTEGSHCEICFQELTAQKKIPPVGHNFQVKTVKAGMAKDGSITETCTVCKKTGSETTVAAVESIRLSKTSFAYNGKKQKPSVTVMDRQGRQLQEGTDYTLTYPANLKNVGIYTVTIQFRGNYSGTEKTTLQILPANASNVRLSAGKKSFTIKWKKQKKQVDGYEIAYSRSSKFPKKTTKTVAAGKSASSKKISKLKAGKKYYVRLRAYKTVKVQGGQKKLYAEWSKVKTVKVKK